MNTVATGMHPNINMQYGNTADLMNSLKPMLLTMLMVKGNDHASGGGNFSQIIWSFIAISLVDFIMHNAPQIIQFVERCLRKMVKKTIVSNAQLMHTVVGSNKLLEKTASITFKVAMEDTNKNCIVYAIVDLLTNLSNTKCIILKNNDYQINYYEPVQIEENIYAKLLDNKIDAEKGTSDASQKPTDYIEVYSYSLNMEELRAYVDKITKEYMLRIKNKLGNKIYYFNEIALTVSYTHTGAVDYSKLPDNLHFTMKPFYTNRKFSNIFGEEMDVIKKRVTFFKNNKKWYDEQGIPYTLGILMSGIPGSGKTSTIKCLANELKRHLVNIHLTNEMSKTQLENLFFNDILYVTQNGRTEYYDIPIDQRIYVLEDIDCQCDFILERSDKEVDLITTLKQKLEELTKTNEGLVQMIENPQKNKIMKMNYPPAANEGHVQKSSQKITLSFLLNLLDGVLETPGRVVVMTTNWIEKLDYALIRPGRFDVKTDFGYCSNTMIVDIFNFRYENKLTEENKEKILNIPERFISPAELGKVLFENFDDMEQALAKILELYNQHTLKNSVALEEEVKSVEPSANSAKPEEVKSVEVEVTPVVKHETAAENPLDAHTKFTRQDNQARCQTKLSQDLSQDYKDLVSQAQANFDKYAQEYKELPADLKCAQITPFYKDTYKNTNKDFFFDLQPQTQDQEMNDDTEFQATYKPFTYQHEEFVL